MATIDTKALYRAAKKIQKASGKSPFYKEDVKRPSPQPAPPIFEEKVESYGTFMICMAGKMGPEEPRILFGDHIRRQVRGMFKSFTFRDMGRRATRA